MVDRCTGKVAIVGGRRVDLGACKPLAHSRAGDVWLLRAPRGWYLLVVAKSEPERVVFLSSLKAYDSFQRMSCRLVSEKEAFPGPAAEDLPGKAEGYVVNYDPSPRPEFPTSGEVSVEDYFGPARTYNLAECQLLAHDADQPAVAGAVRGLFQAPDGSYFFLQVGAGAQARPLSKDAATVWWETMPTKTVHYEDAFGESPQDA